MSKDDLIKELQAENAKLREHRDKLQRAAIIILEDWWPLVYDRTCRNTVRAQGDMLREAISNGPVEDEWL